MITKIWDESKTWQYKNRMNMKNKNMMSVKGKLMKGQRDGGSKREERLMTMVWWGVYQGQIKIRWWIRSLHAHKTTDMEHTDTHTVFGTDTGCFNSVSQNISGVCYCSENQTVSQIWPIHLNCPKLNFYRYNYISHIFLFTYCFINPKVTRRF